MKHSGAFLMAALTAAGALAIAAPADARGRRAQATVQTQHGTAQGQSQVQRARGQRTRDASVTGPNGRQSSVQDQRAWSRADGTYSHDRQRAYANGDTRSVEADAQRTAPGQWSADRTVVGRNGETRTQSGDFSATRTEDGRAISGDIQTSAHGQVDYQRDISRGEDGRTVTSTATFEDGTSLSRQSTGACDGAGQCARSTALTNRDGATTHIEEQRVRTETGAIYDRDTAFSDGSSRAVERQRVGNGDGTGAISRTVIGRDGDVRTQTGTYSVEPTP